VLSWKSLALHARKGLVSLEDIVDRNGDIKGICDEVSDGNEKH
jgi:hypothetical protein